MSIDDLPDQLEAVLDRARATLEQQISKTRKVVDALNAEKAIAAKALGELKEQCTKAKAELETTLADLDRASSLRGLNNEIKKSRKELEQLNAETAKETKALEALVKKRKEDEVRVLRLEDDARQATSERCAAQEMLGRIKTQLGV